MVDGRPMVLPRMMSNEYGGTRSTPSGLFRKEREVMSRPVRWVVR